MSLLHGVTSKKVAVMLGSNSAARRSAGQRTQDSSVLCPMSFYGRVYQLIRVTS